MKITLHNPPGRRARGGGGMKERGIIMNDQMARAVWLDLKTQTRRPVKGITTEKWNGGQCGILDDGPTQWNIGGHVFQSPYGRPGDRLWIRETWREVGSAMRKDDAIPVDRCACRYRADDPTDGPWRPSIHMPRWAARSVREIVAVRVERVQDISEADARAEGVLPLGDDTTSAFRYGFMHIWHSIYGGTEFAWKNNPWVWVYEFKKVEASK